MGMYNTYVEGSVSVQLKVGDTGGMQEFEVGDTAIIPDGAYVGYEGVVVILDGTVEAVFADLHDKWGGTYNLVELGDSHNVLVKTVERLVRKHESDGGETEPGAKALCQCAHGDSNCVEK